MLKLSAQFLCAVQIGLVASQFSLPMLAPLLFGTPILLRSIRTNASLIFPRIGVVVVLLWMLWFFNSVVQNTVVYLRRQVGFAGCPEIAFYSVNGQHSAWCLGEELAAQALE